jgi:hypothetical protein
MTITSAWKLLILRSNVQNEVSGCPMDESHFTENKHYWGFSVGGRFNAIHSPD